MALHHLTTTPLYPEVLLTTVNSHFERVTMHGLRIELLELQAQKIGLPLEKVLLPENASMESYEHVWNGKLDNLKSRGFTDTIFGDIFLEDLKDYRQQQLAPFQITPHFPLWEKTLRP
ncbi:diphthamide synthase [Marinoscillum furvescens DSM 4134]|uniref:Diphthamide synthase n=1 Tax=Marinoscillum furvescens DSM 4134 TaxID=1122208 RepID=A0A3D9KVS7_MARFU|nr:diphthamide synthase [Marinoscillum furvescens DSM 4134]